MTEEKQRQLQAMADAILNSDFAKKVLARASGLQALYGCDIKTAIETAFMEEKNVAEDEIGQREKVTDGWKDFKWEDG